MKCSVCNIEFNDDSKYCCYCGNELEKEKKAPKCFDVFALIGFIMGLVSLIMVFCFGFGIFFADHAIVFSALGKKAYKYRKMANAGLTISIISFILNLIVFAIYVIIICIVVIEFLAYIFILSILK